MRRELLHPCLRDRQRRLGGGDGSLVSRTLRRLLQHLHRPLQPTSDALDALVAHHEGLHGAVEVWLVHLAARQPVARLRQQASCKGKKQRGKRARVSVRGSG